MRRYKSCTGTRFYHAVQPPSTVTLLPVINVEASDARRTIAPPISLLVPTLLSMVLSASFAENSLFARVLSFGNGPGVIAFTLMLYFARCAAP